MNKERNMIIAIGILLILALSIYFISSRNRSINITNPISTTTSTTETPNIEATTTTEIPIKTQSKFIEIINACDWTSVGNCVNMRSGAGTKFPVVNRLRNGVVLKTSGGIVVDGLTWYKIIFGAELKYPERVKGDLYVAGTEYVRYFTEDKDEYASKVNVSSTKHILVDISKEKIYAYDGDKLFMEESISTGLDSTPTPKGTFFILKKTPSRYMQGPTPGVSEQYFDLPGVPWDLYFTNDGDVIHGAYWHNKFGKPWSHGCVNLPTEKAKKLYEWADIGIPVIVQY